MDISRNAIPVPGDDMPIEWSEVLFQYLPDPAFFYDHSSFTVLAVNEAAVQRYGYSREELLAIKPWELEHPFDKEGMLSRIRNLEKKNEHVYVATHRNRAGELFPVEMHARPLMLDRKLHFLVICRDISARIRDEQARLAAETRCKSLFNLALDCMAVGDLDAGHYIDVNPAFIRALGWSREDLTTRSFLEFFHPDERAQVSFLIERDLRNGKPVGHIESRFLTKEGGVRWMEWTAHPDKDGRLTYCVGHDVTERKAASEATRRKEALISALVEVSPVPMVICDQQIRMLRVNAALTELLGYTIEDIPDLDSWVKNVYPDKEYRDQVMALWNEDFSNALKNGVSRFNSPEVQLICKDGSARTVNIGIGISGDHLIIVLTDLTESNRVQELIQVQTQKLALHFEQTPLAVIEWDLEFKVSAWNPGAEQVFGYTRDEIIGKHAACLVAPEFREHVDTVWANLLGLQGGRRSSDNNLRKDGVEIQCEWYNTPLVDEHGEVIGVASLVMDVTELRKREADLLQAREMAERANRAKSEFLSIMSHELRTPLNAIVGPCELLQENLAEVPTDEVEDLLRIMLSSANHLLDLINSVLDLAKIESGNVCPELSEVEIVRFFDERLSPLENVAKRKGLKFEIEHELGSTDRLVTDPRFLAQILFNLIGNAIKFTDTGGITVRVISAGDSNLIFNIIDTGQGIAKDAQRAVFEPFRQVDMSINRRHEGAGLGLAICRQLAEKLGGNITVVSMPGRGSLFRLELPGFSPGLEHPLAEFSSSDSDRISAHPPELKDRILVVEDDPSNRRVFEAFFKRLAVRFDFASTGEEAVKQFAVNPYRIVLMDIRLPGIDGVEATRRIRELPGGKEACIVAQTAFALADQKKEFLASGMDRFIAKPVSLASLRSLLGSIAGSSA